MARKTYPADEYAALSKQLAELISATPQLKFSPGDTPAQLEGKLPSVPVVFIADAYMGLFADLASFDSREIKLVNYGQSAISCRFFTKHKYQIRKDFDTTAIELILRPQIEKIRELLAKDDSEALRVLYAQLVDVMDHPDQYEVAMSNFHRYRYYPYVSYRYRSMDGYESNNEHLIQKQNVFFIDTAGIREDRPSRDDEQARAFLASFRESLSLGKNDFFFKAK